MKNLNRKKSIALSFLLIALAVVSLPVAATAQDVNDFNVPDFNLLEDPNLEVGPQMPGTIEGSGTYFEVTDSNYLNITFESSEPVNLRLESVPEMVVMDINTAEGAASTQITLTGFEPSTTYYKYEDDYHNEVTFTTDENGSCTFAQDISQPHLVFIQPGAGTIFLSDSGWSDTTVGTWDASTQTGTLTRNVYETIQIDSDGITLDGAGHTVTGPGFEPGPFGWSGFGVYLYGRTGVTIKNVNVQGFTYGIHVSHSSGNTIGGNTASNNYWGIYLYFCSNSTLTGNTASSNDEYGIVLGESNGNTLSGNAMSGNRYNFNVYGRALSFYENDIDTTNTVEGRPVYYVVGAADEVYDSSTNAGTFYAINCENISIKDLTLTNNTHGVFLGNTHNSRIENVTASNNVRGICLHYSSANTLTGNSASNNSSGILLQNSSYNTLRDNTTSNGNAIGILLYYSSGNTIAGNTASKNNYSGIDLRYSSNNNTVTANSILNNVYGMCLCYCNGNTLSGNTISGSRYNFWLYGNFGNEIDTTNTVDGKPVYYVVGAADEVYDSSTNAGVFYAINCDNITIRGLTLTNNFFGVLLWNTHNSRIENVTASSNYHGIQLGYSSNNTLTGNTANSNTEYGIRVERSSNNTLTANTASSNIHAGIWIQKSSGNTLTDNTVNSNRYRGIWINRSSNNTLTRNTVNSNNWLGINLMYSSNNNLIYNNNFIDNSTQASVHRCSGNLFNLDKPIGGNFWSNWTSPDDDVDGFVDYPYEFYGGVDYLPLASPYVLNQSPVADAGDNIQITSADQAYTVIQGTASDPDGDALEYRWLEAEQVLLDWSPVGASGEAYLDLATLSYLDVGNHTLTLEARDAELTASDEMILTIQNSPPEAQPAPSSQVVEIGIDPIVVVADAADFDGDTLSYDWLKGSEILASGSVATVQGGDRVPIPDLNIAAGDTRFPLGAHQIELKVSDGINDPVSAFVSVEVIDTTAPSLGPIPSVTILWPPNHELQPVTIAANAFDNGGGAIVLTVEVQSSEPPDTDGDGHTIPDYYVDSVDNETGLIELRLRAERQGKGDGRTYTITITATDESSNQSVATVEILAPHDRRKK